MQTRSLKICEESARPTSLMRGRNLVFSKKCERRPNLNDIEIARRLIERLGGFKAANEFIETCWDNNPIHMMRLTRDSEKYLVLCKEIRRQVGEARSRK